MKLHWKTLRSLNDNICSLLDDFRIVIGNYIYSADKKTMAVYRQSLNDYERCKHNWIECARVTDDGISVVNNE